MPAKEFICPNGGVKPIEDCLNKGCSMKERCLFLPTLRAIAASLERNLEGFTVTELISGTREVYLKKTRDYPVDPMKHLYAVQGSAAHLLHQGQATGNMLGEERIYGDNFSGQIDLYGAILDKDTATLGDYKVTSSYKLMKALGRYKVDVPTGEVYKSGARKGQAKTVKEWREGGVRNIQDWAIQLNCYRMLLEKEGFPVKRMVIQAFCRDQGAMTAKSRGIEKPAYFVEINKINDRWLNRYIKAKSQKLKQALEQKRLPPPCSAKARWHGKKCLEYCDVASLCPYGINLTMGAKSA